MSDWSIRYFERPLGVATHGVIVIYNGNSVVRSYEGLAYSPESGWIPFGTAKAGHLILPYVINRLSPNAEIDGGEVFSGTQSQVLSRMRALDNAAELMTNQRRPYEAPVVDSLNPTNSNSILATFFKVLGVDFPYPVTGTIFGQVGKNNILLTNEVIGTLQSANGYAPNGPSPRCFIAGTQILMADGSQKSIEEIDVDDMVMSFDPDAEDGLGASVPRRVTRTFTNVTRVLIDLWGLHVTPGHEFLADGGEFMKIADILRKDRCFVRQVDGKGVPFRARTNAQMKTLGDVLFRTRFKDPGTGAWRNASVRGSIPFERVLSDRGGVMSARMARLIEVLHYDGRLCVQSFASNGQLRDPKGRTLGVIEWPEGRTPFDAESAENHVVFLDGAPFVPDWVKNIPRDGEELQAVMNAGGGADDRLLISPFGAFTVTTVNGQDQLNPPVSRQQLPPQRPDLRVVSKGGSAPAHQ